MNMQHKLKAAALAALTVICASFGQVAQAQTTPTPAPATQQQTQSFTDAELKQFAEANTRLMSLQQESETKMMGMLQEEKLSVDRFNEMANAHQQQKLAELKASPEEMAAFNKIAQRIMDMQPDLQKAAEVAIQKDGLALDKYKQMMMAYQQDPALQEKVNKMMVKE
ncbi:DUF4168 domain-containing protein [Pontibacter chitinilyticus]|uniref:DUF4168 domain-containing protein n=1 Tax=Pontibacter chitinilyticus TaxID=2674989 RepID=UPI00321A5823